MSFLVLDAVSKTYPGGTQAVKRVDLTIAEGEFVVLLGPSGCGKTTTLRMIAGLETPTAAFRCCVRASRASSAQAAIAQVAERLGLTSLLERRPRELSGGDQQRVGLARAMVRRPAAWLMDEPLGTLDSDQRGEMCEFLRAQQLEARVATVYVTHDQEEAMRLADRVVVMCAGEILQPRRRRRSPTIPRRSSSRASSAARA
ncbi:MAG: ABC transporter ATP-binding protein [Planctomycetes bacterium]|nr:ABC transporter ATP-binding protein [Planctomycetota bacterium]